MTNGVEEFVQASLMIGNRFIAAADDAGHAFAGACAQIQMMREFLEFQDLLGEFEEFRASKRTDFDAELRDA